MRSCPTACADAPWPAPGSSRPPRPRLPAEGSAPCARPRLPAEGSAPCARPRLPAEGSAPPVRPRLPATALRSRAVSSGRGFTLFEVLVTVALVVITIGLAAMVLLGSASTATQARVQAEQEAELLRVASVLRHQMLAIASPLSTQTSVVSEAGQVPHRDTLDIITAGLMHSRGVGRVEWHMIEETGGEPYLAYREEPYLGGADPKKNPWIPFSRLITGMEVRFWSSPAWVPGWHQSVVPERMRVILYYHNGDEGEASFVIEASPGVSQVVETSSSGGGSSSPAPKPSPSASTGASSGASGTGTSGTGTTPGGTAPGTGTLNPGSGGFKAPGTGTSSGGGLP